MQRPLDQPPYSVSCQACVEGQRWVCVEPGQPLTGDEDVICLCPEHARIVEGTPGWRRVWDVPQLPGVPLETHELMTVVAARLEADATASPIPEPLRKALANVFRGTARSVTVASMMNGSAASRYVDQRFGHVIALAELAWQLDIASPGEAGTSAPGGDLGREIS